MAKILVVEDEDDLREIIVESLTDEGHSVVDVPRGQAGLDHLAKESVDLILSDITMPEMNGYQFFRSLREQLPQHANIPFIFMTALADRDDQIKGLRLGVDDYITKPIDFDVMLLRVDTHLRRRQPAPAVADASCMPAPAPAPPADKADPGSYRSDPDSTAKLRAIVEESSDRLMASQFSTISLEKVRARIGEKWAEMSDQILRNAEMVIRAHLGPKDSFCISPSQDFLVCFAELGEDQLISKTSQMRDAIWEQLFKITNDEDLSSVDALCFEISTDREEFNDDVTFSDFDKILCEESKKDKEASKAKLEQIYTYEEIYALPLIGANGVASKIKSLSFNRKIAEKARDLSARLQDDEPFLLNLQKKMFDNLKEKSKSGTSYANHGMLLPIEFCLIRNPDTRKGLTILCKDLEKSLSIVPIIEVINLPDRLKSHKAALTPLPVGRKLQFIELRRPQQADGLDLDELGAAYVSISFDNAEASRSKGLADFAKKLESQNVKLYVKDVPEGKLLDAQRCHGTMFSMMK